MSAESAVVQPVLASVARAQQRAALLAAGGVPRARRGRRGGRSQQMQSIRIDPVKNLYAAPSRSRSRSRGCSSGTGGTLAPLSAKTAGAPLPSALVVLLKAFPKARPFNVFLPKAATRLEPSVVPRSACGDPTPLTPPCPLLPLPASALPPPPPVPLMLPAAPCPAPPIAWPERVLQILHLAGMSEDTCEPLVLSFDNWAQREGPFSSSRPLAERL